MTADDDQPNRAGRPADEGDPDRAGRPAEDGGPDRAGRPAASGRDVPGRAPSGPRRDVAPSRDRDAAEQTSDEPQWPLRRTDGAPLRVDPSDQGGETACWMPWVCPECGRLAETDPPTRCAHCGAVIEAV